MGISTQTVFEYNGSLLGLTAGGLVNANVLNTGSGPLTAEIRDNNGFLTQADDGVSTLTLADGSVVEGEIDYIGAGTVSTIGLLGVNLFPRPVAAFSVDEQIYLIAPNGFPPLSGVSVAFDIDPNEPFGLSGFVPCFLAGTLILTPSGPVPIENLSPGDKVLDHDGIAHTILWHGWRGIKSRASDAPVKIPAGFFGPSVPFLDTYVSQQHRIAMYVPEYGSSPIFVRAKLLLDEGASLATEIDQVVYHHLLFAHHIVLVANGMPSESLRAAKGARTAFGEEAWEEIVAAVPSAEKKPQKLALQEIGRGKLQRRRKQSTRAVSIARKHATNGAAEVAHRHAAE